MLRTGCEPLARSGRFGAGHPRSCDAQCAPTPSNSLPLLGRFAAPRLPEGSGSWHAGFVSFVSLVADPVMGSNAQNLAPPLLGRHQRQIVRQRQSEISDFDHELIGSQELFQPSEHQWTRSGSSSQDPAFCNRSSSRSPRITRPDAYRCVMLGDLWFFGRGARDVIPLELNAHYIYVFIARISWSIFSRAWIRLRRALRCRGLSRSISLIILR
jgi:hypothetical protein